MATWMNSDGLFIRYGTDESDQPRGAHMLDPGANGHVLEFNINYTDALSATPAILGSASATTDGALGVQLPKGAIIYAVETQATTAFTSSGTIGTSTLVIGTKKQSDRSTELDHDGITTTAWTGANIDAQGERVYLTKNGTGAGAHIDNALSENGLIVVSNSQHGSHPFTAGVVRVRVFYRFA